MQREFAIIIEDMKDIISNEIDGKVLDKHVAFQLGVSSENLATNKKRGKIMYSELLLWAAKRKLSINSLLFSQAPESLVNPTNELYFSRKLNYNF